MSDPEAVSRRQRSSLIALLLLAFAILVVVPASAHADGGSGHCEPWIPSCTVRVGDGGGTGGGGSSGGGGTGGGGSGGGGGTVAVGCHNTDPTGNGCDPCYSYPNGPP